MATYIYIYVYVYVYIDILLYITTSKLPFSKTIPFQKQSAFHADLYSSIVSCLVIIKCFFWEDVGGRDGKPTI